MEMGWPCWIVLLLHLLLLLPFVFNQTHVVNNLPHNRLLLLCSSTLHQGLAFQEFTYHELMENGGTARPCGQHATQPLCCACRVKVLNARNQLAMQKTFSLLHSESHFEVSNLIFTSEYLIANEKGNAPRQEPWTYLSEVMLWPQNSQIPCGLHFSRDVETFMTIMQPLYKLSEASHMKITIENQKADDMDVTCANTLERRKSEMFHMKKGSTHELTLHTRPDIFHACRFRAGNKSKFNMVIFIYAYFEPFVGKLNYVGLMEDGLIYSGEYAKHEMQFLWMDRPGEPVYPSGLRHELLTDTAKKLVKEVF